MTLVVPVQASLRCAPLWARWLVVGFALLSSLAASADTLLVASVLPNSRSVQVNTPATLFATVLNAGSEAGSNCRIEPDVAVSGSFHYQATDPVTNQPVGTADTPVAIDVGGLATFLVVLTADSVQAPTEVALQFVCDNAPVAGPIVGVNTFTFSASNPPVPDVIALGATPTSNGVVELPDSSGINVFSVASVNLGAGDTLQVTATLSDPGIAATISICETDPITSICINPLTPTTGSVTTTVSSQATPTFGVFVTSTGVVPFDPATNRIFVRFDDADGIVRGSTSVALRTEAVAPFTSNMLVGTTLWSKTAVSDRLAGVAAGQVFNANGSGVNYENTLGFRSGQAYADISEAFSWSIAAGKLNVAFADFAMKEVAFVFGDYSPLVDVYGLPQSVADFFQNLWDNGQLGSQLEIEKKLLSRRSAIVSALGGKIQVISTTAQRYSMDVELLRHGWSGALPVGSEQSVSANEELTSASSIATAPGQTVVAGETWAVPFVFSPQDPLVQNQPAAYVVDALSFQIGGTTGVGRLSGESFAWFNDANTLVFESGNERHRLTTLQTFGNERLALAEYYINNQLALVSGQLISRGDASGASLSSDLVDVDPITWQAGLNIWPASLYRPDGLLMTDSVFGYQFVDGSNAGRVNGHLANDGGCPGASVGCFTKETGVLWAWSVADNLITRTRTDNGTMRARTWEVLSYTPGGRAVVVESAVWQTGSNPARFVIPPRINTLEAFDLADWSAALANSPDFN